MAGQTYFTQRAKSPSGCKGTCQRIPSGTEAVASIESPDLWLQSLPSYHHQLKAWQNGGDHLCVKSPVSCCRWEKYLRKPRFWKRRPIIRLVSRLNAREKCEVFPPSRCGQSFYTTWAKNDHSPSQRDRPLSGSCAASNFGRRYTNSFPS